MIMHIEKNNEDVFGRIKEKSSIFIKLVKLLNLDF